MNRRLSPHSQITVFHMLKLHLDTPYFYRMEYMQEHVIKTTQTTRRYTFVLCFFLIRGKVDFVQICTNTILKIRYHQVMILQPTITNTNHEINCISHCFLHISITTFSPKVAYFTIWSITTMWTSSKSTWPADVYWDDISVYCFILLTLVHRRFKHLFQSTPAAMLGDPHI